MKKEHTIWCEKYRPKTLEEYSCSPEIKEKMQEYISAQDIPHLLFPGTQGAGKSTLAKILANSIDCDYIYLNATENRDMESIKNEVGKFAAASSFRPLKIVILDEATHILQASQVLLLNMIEKYSLKTRFILTGNYVERLIPALRSRLTQFDLVSPPKKEIAQNISNILDKENVKYDIKDLAFVINKFYPDQRSIINFCQQHTSNNVLNINKNEIIDREKYISVILENFKKPSSKSFNIIRQSIADSKIGDFDDVYKELYSNISEYAGGREGMITVIIEEYMFHKNFRIDGEICLMACIHKILEILNKKQII